MDEGRIAILMLQHLAKFLDEKMEDAKGKNYDTPEGQKKLNIAGFAADIKKELSLEKARIIGKM